MLICLSLNIILLCLSIQIGRRIFRQRLETGDKEMAVQERRHLLIVLMKSIMAVLCCILEFSTCSTLSYNAI